MSYGLDTSHPSVLIVRFLLNHFDEADMQRALIDPQLSLANLATYAAIVVDLTSVRELNHSQLTFLLIVYDRVVTATKQRPGAVWNRPGDLDDQLGAFAKVVRDNGMKGSGFIYWRSVDEALRRASKNPRKRKE